jgi:hypothetical protein
VHARQQLREDCVDVSVAGRMVKHHCRRGRRPSWLRAGHERPNRTFSI